MLLAAIFSTSGAVNSNDVTNSQAQQFLAALNSTNLTQLVSFPTHRDNHTLDLVITASTSSLSLAIDHSPVSPVPNLLYLNHLTNPYFSIVQTDNGEGGSGELPPVHQQL